MNKWMNDEERQHEEGARSSADRQPEEFASPLISRRKLLASIGAIGAAVTASTILTVNGDSVLLGKDDEKLKNGSKGVSTKIADLRSLKKLENDLYYVTDKGKEGYFYYDSADRQSADNEGTVLVSASGHRFQRIITDDFVKVTWFGAVGDGVTDDGAAIQAANDFAASIQAKLYFPSGIYVGYGFRPTTSWFAYGTAVIRNAKQLPPSQEDFGFVEVHKQTGLRFEGLTFDGNVSADPPSWNSSNYNQFSGACSMHIFESSHIHIHHCTFQNSFFSTLRIHGSHDIVVENSHMRKARGNFGDAVYVQFSDHVRFHHCLAEDYTRIGFVTDLSVSNVSYSQCYARNGHHASNKYGGVESNGGFWVEQAENVLFSQCISENNSDTGFICVTGDGTPHQTPTASFVLEGCLAINNGTYGYVMNALGTGNSATINCFGCHSYGSPLGFHLTQYNSTDSMSFVDCLVHMSLADSSREYIGFLINNEAAQTNTGSVHMTNCKTIHGDGNNAKLLSPDYLMADFVFYHAGRSKVTIDNFINGGPLESVVIKSFNGGKPTLHVRNSNVIVPYIMEFTELKFDHCRFDSSVRIGEGGSDGAIEFNDCEFRCGVNIVTQGAIRLNSAIVKLADADTFSISRNNATKKIMNEFYHCRFEKNLETTDYLLKIEENGQEKPMSLFMNCTFYQTSGTTRVDKSFVWAVGNGTPARFATCFSDMAVPNLLKEGSSLVSPDGNTLIEMH